MTSGRKKILLFALPIASVAVLAIGCELSALDRTKQYADMYDAAPIVVATPDTGTPAATDSGAADSGATDSGAADSATTDAGATDGSTPVDAAKD